MPENTNITPQLKSLAGFAQRAGLIINGREKLKRHLRSLQCIILSTELSKNSLREAQHDYNCPMYHCFTTAEIESLFGLKNTKILGLKQNQLSKNIEAMLAK